MGERYWYIQGEYFHFGFQYNKEILADLKLLKGGLYNPQNKEWAFKIGVRKKEAINEIVKKYDFKKKKEEESIPPQLNIYPKEEIEVARKYTETKNFAYTPRNYQVEWLIYSLFHAKALLSDSMGCGKTYESILSVEIGDKFPCLVVTPSSVKYGFAKEWGGVTKNRRSVSVIESKSNLKKGEENDWSTDVVIINYDIIGDWQTTKKGTKVAVPRFDELSDIKWKSIICDESHFLKNPKSKRTKTIAKIIKPIDTRYFMTGTVIENRVMELWEQLKLLGTEKMISKDWMEFAYRYANAKKEYFAWNTDGNSNLMELHQKLRDNCYVRRELIHVRSEVPIEQRKTIDISISNRKEYDEADKDIYSYLLKHKGEEAAEKADGSQENLVKESVLSRLSIDGKMEQIIEYLNDWKDSTDDKLIIFGNHREPLEELSKTFECDKIVGGVSAKDKQRIIEEWRTNDKQFMFANMVSAGTGTDGLQHSCHNMLIIELPPKPSLLEQVIARIVRIGQKYPSMITFMLDTSAIDGKDLERIGGKEMLTNAVNKGINVN